MDKLSKLFIFHFKHQLFLLFIKNHTGNKKSYYFIIL